MATPYSKNLDVAWSSKQNFREVVFGDEIFEVTLKGAKILEAAWRKVANPWNKILDKSVQTGFLGWGAPIVDRRWLSFVLFGNKKNWPNGLTPREKSILELAVAVSHYFPLYEQGVITDRKWGLTQDPDKAEPEAATLAAMKSYAQKFEKNIAIPMWDAYDDTTEKMAPLIMEACQKVYSEPCDNDSARRIFRGDLERGWNKETLKVDGTTYRVFGHFIDYIILVVGSEEKTER